MVFRVVGVALGLGLGRETALSEGGRKKGRRKHMVKLKGEKEDKEKRDEERTKAIQRQMTGAE